MKKSVVVILINKQLLIICFLAVMLNLIANLSAAQTAGTLDENFGEGGKVVTSQSNAVLNSYSSLLQKDGKIILAGYRAGFLFMRYLTNGMIDSSFGINGMAEVNFTEYSSEYVASMVQQSDGKIVACGEGYTGYPDANYNGLMVRLNADGSLDSSFADNGKLIYDSYRGQDHFTKLLLKDDGKILACGTIYYHAVLLVQLLSDGRYDPFFGNNGVMQDEDISYNIADAALESGGKIVTGGAYGYGYNFKICLSRYLPDGTLDQGFGNKGKTITNPEGNSEQVFAIAIQQDGKIIGAGNSNGFDNIATVLRYTTEGFLDNSFGTNGVVYTNYPTGWASARDVVIQPDGKIVTCVSNFDYDQDYVYFAANRYKTNGTLDSSFGKNGTSISLLNGSDTPSSMLLQPDGKIVISGSTFISETGYSGLGMIRYLGDPQEKYVHIKKWLHKHGITWEDKPDNYTSYYSIQRSTNGSAFTEIARIFNRGSNTTQSFEDAGHAGGTNYYRVAVVSRSNTVNYSNIIAIDNSTTNIKVYPNPVKNSLQVEGLPATQKTKLSITDLNGNTRMTATANAATYSWNVALLPKGNYVLHAQTGSAAVAKKFVKE